MIKVLFGWAGIILWLAAPVILVLAVGAGLVTSGGLFLRSFSNPKLLPAAVAVLAIAAAAAYFGYRYFSAPSVALPALEIMRPSPLDGRDPPRTLVTGGWQALSTGSSLLRQGAVDRVLRPSEHRAKSRDPDTRLTLFQSLELNAGPGCPRAFSALEPDQVTKCTDWVEVVLPEGRPAEPHLLLATSDTHYPTRTETLEFWFVEGELKQLVARCHAAWPRGVHPLTDFLQKKHAHAVSQAFAQCRHDALRLVFDIR